METSIPALVIAAMLLVSTVVLGRSSYSSFDELGSSWKQMEARAGEQARTLLAITNVSHSSPNVDVEVQNNGSTKISDFEHMDVVVEYTTGAGAPVIAWIPYTDGSLGANTWTVQSITNDAFEPGIFNPSETLQIRIQLDPPVGSGTTNRLLITTDLGVIVSTPFTG
jgi:archaellum component FlaF (FlaF/FlaG flagellin family)